MTEPSESGRRADASRNRTALVEAGTRVMGENPSASLEDVAVAAELTRTTVYRHFPNRESLVTAIYSDALDQVGSALAAAELDEGRVGAAVERALDAILSSAGEYRVLIAGPSANLADEHLERSYELAIAPVVALIERGQKAGSIDSEQPPWWLADALFSHVFDALLRVADGRIEIAEARPLILRIFWGGAGPR